MVFNDTLPPDGTVMTTAAYLQTEETRRVHQLWYGTLRVAESPTSWHQDLAFEIAVPIRAHAGRGNLGRVWMAPLDVVLDPARAVILQPDVLFVARDRLGIVTDKVRGVPDLVAEVLSPRPRLGTTLERVACFAHYGVRECWLVHQLARTVEVLTLRGGVVAGRVLVGAAEPIPSHVLPSIPIRLGDLTP